MGIATPAADSSHLVVDALEERCESLDNHEAPPRDLYCLPVYELCHSPNFIWGDMDEDTFSRTIKTACKEVVHWRRNLLKVPSGKTGKAFVRELARLFQAYAEGSAMESVALTCVMTMPALLLQKPFQSSKVREHVSCLKRRLKAWSDGKIDLLLHEGRTACRLKALNKCLGVRPIGIGEVVRHTLGKAILTATSPEVQQVIGAL